MNESASTLAGAALLTLLTLTGCSPADPVRIAVHSDLPEWPRACRAGTPHAPVQPGDDAVSVLARERDQLDRANATAAACGAFYDDLRAELRAMRR